MDLVKYDKNWLQRLRETPKISEYAEGKTDIAKTIAFASEYYGIKEPSKDVIQILAMEVVNDYPNLRKGELMEAFKLASKQKIDVSLELYGRPMNAWLIHQIIKAYMVFRASEAKKLNDKPKDYGQREPCPPEISKKINERYEKEKSKVNLKFKRWQKGE